MTKNAVLQNHHEYASFLKNALALEGSVTPKVMKKVVFIIIYSLLVSCLCYFVPSAVLPIGPFEYGGLIMGLILVFRVNAGYDRWWEARKLWGNIVNRSRHLAIILINYTQQESPEWVFKITNMIAALPYLMKDHLRDNNNLQNMEHLLNASQIHKLRSANNVPMILTSWITQELHKARNQHGLDSFAFLHAHEQIEHIIDSQGACERILKTPMPFVMAVKARRFILFFLLALPFALENISVFISPFVAGIVSYALFSLDQIGVELQNPFSDKNLSHLPLDNICQTIYDNIKEIQQEFQRREFTD